MIGLWAGDLQETDMRTLMIACTFWFWRRLIVRGLSQARDEGVISGSQFEMLDRAFNGEHIWDRD